MDPKHTDCLAAARTLVDQPFIEGLKAPRPRMVALATLLIWVQLLGAWALGLAAPLWLLWLPFLMNCATTQAMLLWVHEASHSSFCGDRRLNDIWADIFFAGPIGISVGSYRARHMTHHAHLGTDRDEDGYPYRMNVKGRRALAWLALRTLTGAMGFWLARNKYLGENAASKSRSYSPQWLAPLTTLAFNLAALCLCIWTGRWYVYFVIWAYPILAMAILINIVRTIAEHQPENFAATATGDEAGMQPVMRTTIPARFEKWMMYQANFNYHVEHHLFPAIPQHNLRLLHLHLVERGYYRAFPDALQRSGITKFYRFARSRTARDLSGAVRDAALHS